MATRRDARTSSRAMLLAGYAKSPEASAFVGTIVRDALIPYRHAQGQLRPTMVPKYRAVSEAFLADLLAAAADGRWSKLSTDNDHLAAIPGGKSAFQLMRGALAAAGYLEELPGYYREYVQFGVKQRKASRTCFRPTARLMALAEAAGISLSDVRRHFAYRKASASTAEGVLYLIPSKRLGEGKPKRIPVPSGDPAADEIVEAMGRLNAFLLADGRISGIAFSGLRRSFNDADLPGFAYQWHGRYYSMPEADHYERLEGGKATRQRMILIDGKPAREVDIRASQLTILHGLLGLPFDPPDDPYGFPGVDRELVKQWLLLVLGSSGARHGGNRLTKAKAAGLSRYPVLSDIPQLGIGPLDLQFHEAEIIRLAMESLMDRGIGFLPVHDALLVAEGNEPIAAEALLCSFDRYFRGRLGKATAPVPRLKWDGQGTSPAAVRP